MEIYFPEFFNLHFISINEAIIKGIIITKLVKTGPTIKSKDEPNLIEKYAGNLYDVIRNTTDTSLHKKVLFGFIQHEYTGHASNGENIISTSMGTGARRIPSISVTK